MTKCVIIDIMSKFSFSLVNLSYNRFQLDPVHFLWVVCICLHLCIAPSLCFHLFLCDLWLQKVSTQHIPQPRCVLFLVAFSRFLASPILVNISSFLDLSVRFILIVLHHSHILQLSRYFYFDYVCFAAI